MQEEAVSAVVVNLISEYGPLGMVLCYCLYTDWTSRREARKNEQDRILREDAREVTREKLARKREDECVARIHALEGRHAEELARVAERSARAIEALTRALGNGYRKRATEETVALERHDAH